MAARTEGRAEGVVGTPRYMAPEQLQQKPIDPRADIFSYGVSAYDVLTGIKPYGNDTPADILQKELDGHVTSPFGLRDRPVIGNGILGSRYHQGTDIASGYAATVKAAGGWPVSGGTRSRASVVAFRWLPSGRASLRNVCARRRNRSVFRTAPPVASPTGLRLRPACASPFPSRPMRFSSSRPTRRWQCRRS